MFLAFVYLSIFCAGIKLILQIQHFGLYPSGGREQFAAYIAANNRAAIFPSIALAIALTVLSVVLLFRRPACFSGTQAIICAAMNVANIAFTGIWQGKLHGELTRKGYDEPLVRRLILTNWIRTVALLLQSFVAFSPLLTLNG